jgi:FkbM family methyltransferase
MKVNSKNAVDADMVRLAYRMILGRNPESEQVIRDHMVFDSPEALGNAMVNSDEFRAKFLQRQFSGSKWVAVDVLDRYVMWVDLHDRYVSYGCLNNNWEPEETSFFSSRLRAGDTVLDIGANVGWFSLVAAKFIGSNGIVHAFEPRPITAKMLARTIAQNGLRRIVQVWEYALSDSSGELFLNWAVNTENPGGSFVTTTDSQFGVVGERVRVRAVRLDDLLPDVAPDIIKIDVEGAEPMVFSGATNALRRKKPVILSELFPEQLMRVSGKTAAQYIAQMEEFGYACYLLENGQPTNRLKDFPNNYSKELASVIFEFVGTRA